MDADRWQRLSPLLDALLELTAGDRRRSLDSLRADDPRLAEDLEGLLALEEGQEDFLAEPLVAQLPRAREGAMVGPYRLERLLGEGGMGQVWLASRADGLYQKRVALKLLRPGIADPNLRLRFTRERQILARLEHAHIARLLDAGISGETQPYLALEYVEGEPITDWCRARELQVAQRIRLFLQVCEAVSHAHANLIVHRDLKPSNILVTPLDEARLLDFGIAKLLDTAEHGLDNTRTGLRAFTLHYAAPEQIRGEPVTTMTDVYSLGVVLYELLVDAKPYRLKRQSDAEWEEAILSVDPMRPSVALHRLADDAGRDGTALRRRAREVAGDLDNIVLKALGKRPEQRYPSVEALALDLRRYLDGKPVQARGQSVAYRTRKYVRRHRWSLLTAGLVASVLVVALGLVAWQAQQAVHEAARAQAMQRFVVGLFENAGSTPSDVPLDVRRLLDTGVERVDLELSQQPVARAELLGVIARLRAGLGDYEQALALQHHQAAIIMTLGDDAPASLRLEAATGLGRTRRALGQNAPCVDGLRPLGRLAQREERRLPLQAADFHSQLGQCQRGLGRRDLARAAFQRSLGIRRDLAESGSGIVENLSDLAMLHADAGDGRRALREQRAALSLLRDTLGPRHPLAVDMLRTLCAQERDQGELRSAERDCRAALALSRDVHGDDHRATVDARRQLAALLVDRGELARAEAEFRDTHGWLVARLGASHADVARNLNSLSIVAWERGRIDDALRDSDAAIAIWRRGTQPSLLAGGLFNRAMILHAEGQHAAARPLVAEAIQLRAAQFGANHGSVGGAWRLLGEIDAALGRHAAAGAALRRAAALTEAHYGHGHPQARHAALSLARHDAAHGDRDGAARLAAIAALPGDDHEQRKLAWRARGYLAATHCAGDLPTALEELATLQDELAARLPEGGELLREVDATRRECSRPAGLAAATR